MASSKIDMGTLDQIKKSEFSVLLFYAKGCKFCEEAKPVFDLMSDRFPRIQFLKANLTSIKEHYDLFAEEEQSKRFEPIYEGIEPKKDEFGNIVTAAVLETNEDGSPKMSKVYRFPSFYIYHTKAQSADNPWGFIGGFDGHNPSEVEAVLSELNNLLPHE